MDLSEVTQKVSPFQAIRSCCIQQGLCFKCLKPYDATHTVNGQRKCPNQNATFAEKMKLLKAANKPKPHQIAAIDEEEAVRDLDEAAWRALNDEELSRCKSW